MQVVKQECDITPGANAFRGMCRLGRCWAISLRLRAGIFCRDFASVDLHRETRDYLPFALIENLKILFMEIADGAACTIQNQNRHQDFMDSHLELRRSGRRRGSRALLWAAEVIPAK